MLLCLAASMDAKPRPRGRSFSCAFMQVYLVGGVDSKAAGALCFPAARVGIAVRGKWEIAGSFDSVGFACARATDPFKPRHRSRRCNVRHAAAQGGRTRTVFSPSRRIEITSTKRALRNALRVNTARHAPWPRADGYNTPHSVDLRVSRASACVRP